MECLPLYGVSSVCLLAAFPVPDDRKVSGAVDEARAFSAGSGGDVCVRSYHFLIVMSVSGRTGDAEKRIPAGSQDH